MRAIMLVSTLLVVGLSGCLNPEGPVDRTPAEMDHAALLPDGSWNLTYFGAHNDPFLGNPDAAVVVIAYDAPGCPSCKRFHDTALPVIESDYIETGLIGYYMLQYRVGYSYDLTGGIVEECAFREGGSEVYVDAVSRVFANARDEGELPGILSALASDHGLDEQVLMDCYENEETLDEVNADFQSGRSSGAGSNPGFAVLGRDGFVKYIRGSEGPKTAIEEALAA